MSAGSDTSRTIRAWRRAFFGIYLLFTAGVTLCVLLSILAVHCGWGQPVVFSGPRIDPGARKIRELRTCQADLARLLSDLHDETLVLQARWRHTWAAVGYRCRLSELSGKGTSAEIDRMERVHAALAELQLSYSEVINRFFERYADRLRQLRTELDAVRTMIERRQRLPARERTSPVSGEQP